MHYFTSNNCIFMQLQGIVFIQLQGNYILVNCQGNLKFIQWNYIHFKELISSFKEIYSRSRKTFIQGNDIHSRKYIYLRNIYSLKFKVICSFNEHCCVGGNSRNIYSKIVPSHFMIIISFTVSWINYSYNSFRLKDEEIADMIEGSVL